MKSANSRSICRASFFVCCRNAKFSVSAAAKLRGRHPRDRGHELDLAESVRKREFREDLYYRLNVVPLRMPSLRDRVSDVAHLANHFLRAVCELEAIPEKRLSDSAVAAMQSYSWPGNVRQLQHAVEMAVVLSGDRRNLSGWTSPCPRRRPVLSESNDACR